MKVLYVCKSQGGIDGGAIYDKRLISELKSRYKDVIVFSVETRARLLPPFWRRNFLLTDEELDSLIEMRAGRFCIISHEVLGDLAPILKPDRFIFHNVFSLFSFPNRYLLQFYYRFQSKSFENKIIESSSSVVLLSKREYRFLSKNYGRSKIKCIFPGCRSVTEDRFDNEFRADLIRRVGSVEWYPKKVSMLSIDELDILARKGFNIITDQDSRRAITLIEDKFLSGFKLKLMDALQRGDFVVSFVDLTEEVSELDSHFLNSFRFVRSFEELIVFLDGFGAEIQSGFVVSNYFSSSIKSRYSWDKVLEKLVEEV